MPYAVRIAAFDQLHCTFNGDIGGRRNEHMEVIGHDDEGVELEAPLAAIVVQSFQEESGIGFDDEEPSALEGCRAHEIRSGWRD